MESVRFHDNYIFAETIRFDSNSPAIRHFKKTTQHRKDEKAEYLLDWRSKL